MTELFEKISVIMPAYNEEHLIHRSVQETARVLDGHSYEIIVVDDGSQDNTYSMVQTEAVNNSRVKAVRYDMNRGKGWALRHGFQFASGDLVAFLDADLDLQPRQIWTLCQVMEETGAEVVIGSKRHPESRLDYPWPRRLISTVYFALRWLLFDLPVHDTQTGIKLFRYQVLRDAFPRMRISRFAFDLELLVAASRFGYRIAEAPVTLTYHREKPGRVSVKTLVGTLFDTLAIFYRASFWKWLGPARTTKLWMMMLAVGLVALGVGFSKILTSMYFPGVLSTLMQYALLQFMPQTLRNWLLFVGGAVLVAISLLQLNKQILAAFAHTDTGDLAGITRRSPHQDGTEHPAESDAVKPTDNLRGGRDEASQPGGGYSTFSFGGYPLEER